MPTVDRTQYEILRDEEVPYNTVDAENPPFMPLRLDATHNLDMFFSQIYEYHRVGGFAVSFSLMKSKFLLVHLVLIEKLHSVCIAIYYITRIISIVALLKVCARC